MRQAVRTQLVGRLATGWEIFYVHSGRESNLRLKISTCYTVSLSMGQRERERQISCCVMYAINGDPLVSLTRLILTGFVSGWL